MIEEEVASLRQLRGSVLRGTGQDTVLDEELRRMLYFPAQPGWNLCPAFTANTDAALLLARFVMPGWQFIMESSSAGASTCRASLIRTPSRTGDNVFAGPGPAMSLPRAILYTVLTALISRSDYDW